MNERNCPDCNKILKYSNKYKLQRAINAKSVCKKCLKTHPSKNRGNIIYNTYGRLVVIASNGTKKGIQYWLCKCQCGNTTIVRHSHLTGQSIRSCGCSHFYTNNNHPHWIGHEEISGTFFTNLKRSAKKRKLKFKLTIEYIWNLFIEQDRKCKYTKKTIKFNKTLKDREGTASLDRIDSSKGYIEGNVQWVHKDVNIMKWDFNESDFLNWCNEITKNNKINLETDYQI
jgi:hypothetical protein